MWNMNYTVPTLTILAIITGAYLSRKRLPLKVSRMFGHLLVISLITIVMDLSSTWMDMHGSMFPDPLLWLMNYLFFVFFLLRSFVLFWLPVELFEAYKPLKRKKVFRTIEIVEQAFLLFGCVSGCVFSIHDHGYVSGPLYEFINVQFMAWIVIGFAGLIRLKHSVEIRKGGVYAYFTILMAGVIIRTLFNHIVIMNLFSVMAILIIYLLYMNPDQYIDDASRLFNLKGWKKVLREAPVYQNFCMVGFGIRNYQALLETRGSEKIEKAVDQIGLWIRQVWPHLSGFYLDNGVFVISDIRSFDRESVLNQIRQRFELPWDAESGEYYLSVNEMQMSGCYQMKSSTLISTMWDIYPQLIQPDAVDPITVNEERIQKTSRRIEVQKLLADALNHNSLAMFLQPIVNTKTDTAEGCEALCRLPDGKGGYVYPDEFIPLASKDASTGKLGIQMFEKACAFMNREDIRFSNIRWINVNVAPEQFRNPNLLDRFLAILEKYHLDPSVIHLEITEETMIDRTLLHESMRKFREKGFIFAMDDFGSSYSNMIRLQQNHFSSVKIDRDFTWSYFRHRTSLLPDIIHTCHNLHVNVVTEGVETEEMVKGVKELGVDYIQGYYYSRPIPVDEFVQKFVKQNH